VAIFGIQSTSKFNDLQLNSLRKRTENYFGGTGNSGAGTGNFTSHIQIHHRMAFSSHSLKTLGTKRPRNIEGG
jgi:hypothetical protein